MNSITNIISTYSRMGKGLQIHIIRMDGTIRTYKYQSHYYFMLYSLTMDWYACNFPRSIHLSRDLS